MIWIKNKYYPLGEFNAVTHWPFVFYKTIGADTVNHEGIHAVQQLECFLIALLVMALFGVNWYLLPLAYLSFYIIYGLNWLFEVVKMLFGGDKLAYKDLLFEKEAMDYEGYSQYLTVRKDFAWLFKKQHTN